MNFRLYLNSSAMIYSALDSLSFKEADSRSLCACADFEPLEVPIYVLPTSGFSNIPVQLTARTRTRYQLAPPLFPRATTLSSRYTHHCIHLSPPTATCSLTQVPFQDALSRNNGAHCPLVMISTPLSPKPRALSFLCSNHDA